MQPHIEDLLIAALNFEGDASQFVEELHEDNETKLEVLSLCDAARLADGFLSRSPVHHIADKTSFEIDLIGGRLGAYQLVEKLGEGGMGTVYLAKRADGQYHQKAAIKLLSHCFHANAVRQFKSERQILANLNHPNIVRLLDGGEHRDQRPYMIMELVEGAPIDIFCGNNNLSLRERLNLFEQVCDAVQYTHAQGIIHRDLKPSNIYVSNQGQVKLLDFGVAKLTTGEPIDHIVPFTPVYAAPEQIHGGRITAATDVYSLGIILLEILTGHRPDKNDVSTALKTLSALDMGGGLKDIERIILNALQNDSTKRFHSVYELRCALVKCQKARHLWWKYCLSPLTKPLASVKRLRIGT